MPVGPGVPFCPPCYPAISPALPSALSLLESRWTSSHPLAPVAGGEQRGKQPWLLAVVPEQQPGGVGPPGSHRISVFQGEALRLKQDASALLGRVDTDTAQYRQLQSRAGRWEEEIKQALRRGEGERAVRGWLGWGCGVSHLQRELDGASTGRPWHHCCHVLSQPVCQGEVVLPAGCRIAPFLTNPVWIFRSWWETSLRAQSCWCRVSPAHRLPVRQAEELLLERLELR